MVERSFIGLTRSGLTQTSADERTENNCSSGARPRNVTKSLGPIRPKAPPSVAGSDHRRPARIECPFARGRAQDVDRVEQKVDALLIADDPDEADQISPSILPSRIRRRDAHAAKIRSTSDDKHTIFRLATALYRNLAIALVGGNDDIGEKERQPLK